MINSVFFLLQAQAVGSPWMSVAMIVLIIVVFYFFMIRPQMKRQKELKQFQESLKKGDRVLVAGGIFGKVEEIKDDSIVVEIAHETTVRVLKNAVYRDATDVK
ncbi:MAG: preprotein translocase subunit YajC [Bacteroides sp.]